MAAREQQAEHDGSAARPQARNRGAQALLTGQAPDQRQGPASVSSARHEKLPSKNRVANLTFYYVMFF